MNTQTQKETGEGFAPRVDDRDEIIRGLVEHAQDDIRLAEMQASGANFWHTAEDCRNIRISIEKLLSSIPLPQSLIEKQKAFRAKWRLPAHWHECEVTEKQIVELQRERNELLDALKGIIKGIDSGYVNLGIHDQYNYSGVVAVDNARKAIAKIENTRLVERQTAPRIQKHNCNLKSVKGNQ